MHVAGSSAVTRFKPPAACFNREKRESISDVKMMTICYLFVVTLTCCFEHGAAQTVAALAPPTDIGHLHLLYVTCKDFTSFESLRQNRYVLTLSCKDAASLNSPMSTYVYEDVIYWELQSCTEALKAADFALDEWLSFKFENHKYYLVASIFYTTTGSKSQEFLSDIRTAIGYYIIKEVIVDLRLIP